MTSITIISNKDCVVHTRKIFSQSQIPILSNESSMRMFFFSGGEKIRLAIAPSIECIGVPSFDGKLKDAHIVNREIPSPRFPFRP